MCDITPGTGKFASASVSKYGKKLLDAQFTYRIVERAAGDIAPRLYEFPIK